MSGQLECPYCGHIDRDACEIGQGGDGSWDTECPSCGKEFICNRTISVSYEATKPKDTNEQG